MQNEHENAGHLLSTPGGPTSRDRVWAWLRAMQKQGEDQIWRGADRAVCYLTKLEAENERLSKAVCSGVLGELLNDEEKDANGRLHQGSAGRGVMTVNLFADTLDQTDCLRLIHEGDEEGPVPAEVILRARLPQAARRFNAIDKSLRVFLADVRKVFPDAQYYTASGGFTLMLGSSHDVRGEVGQQELVALSGYANIGDGDF